MAFPDHRFHALFDASPNPYLVLDRQLNIVVANQAYLASTGRTLDEIVGRWAWEAFPADARTMRHMVASFERVIQTGQADTMALLRYDIARPLEQGGGLETRYWTITHSPVFGADGEVEMVMQHPIDVTEIERMRQAAGAAEGEQAPLLAEQAGLLDRARHVYEANLHLQADVERLKSLFLKAPSFMAVLRGPQHVFEFVNEASIELLGRRDYVGRTVREALPELGDQRLFEVLDKVYASSREYLGYDIPIRVRRGPENALELRYINVIYQPIVEEGLIAGIFAEGTDVTEQHLSRRLVEEQVQQLRQVAVETVAAQAELRAERDQSQYIFDTMAEGFGLLDRDWTVKRMNAAGLELIQRSEHEVVGRNHWEAFPHAAGTEIERICREVMATGVAGMVEYAYPLADGERLWLEVRAYPAMDGGLAIFFRDITKRRRAQDQLRLEAQRKDEFLAMLAHELRNPLAPIGAAAELLALGRLDAEGVRRTSAIVTRQVGHMTSLIDDLLDVSRVTRGLVALESAPVDVKDTVADAVEQVRPLVEGRRHRLEVHLAAEHAVVEGDRKRLVQVLANLLGNAAKYTPEGGRIVVHMEVNREQVVLCVMDNGIGMTPEVQRSVFGLFTQAERTSDRSQGGLGIGLALVKSLVELHGGTVAVHSDGPGQGSQFSICLPRMAIQPGAGAAGVPGQGAPAAAVAGRSVLVVDDNVDAAQLLGMMLESVGHRVHVEHDGRAALAHVGGQDAGACEVCILDIGLPGMDGNELARHLRQLPQTRAALLIAVTGYGRPQDREASLASGFDHHLVKPVDIGQLLALLA